MGNDQSLDSQVNQYEFLNCLLEKDRMTDHSFWVNLMKNAENQRISQIPDSIFLHEVAEKYPLNFINMMLSCVSEVENLEEKSSSDISQTDLNKLSLAIRLFTSCATVLVNSPALGKLLRQLDNNMFIKVRQLYQNELQSNLAMRNQLIGSTTNKENIQQNTTDSNQENIQQNAANSNKENDKDEKLERKTKLNPGLPKDPNAAQKVPKKSTKNAQSDQSEKNAENQNKMKRQKLQPRDANQMQQGTQKAKRQDDVVGTNDPNKSPKGTKMEQKLSRPNESNKEASKIVHKDQANIQRTQKSRSPSANKENQRMQSPTNQKAATHQKNNAVSNTTPKTHDKKASNTKQNNPDSAKAKRAGVKKASQEKKAGNQVSVHKQTNANNTVKAEVNNQKSQLQENTNANSRSGTSVSKKINYQNANTQTEPPKLHEQSPAPVQNNSSNLSKHRQMLKFYGHIFTDYSNLLSKLLFKEGITILNQNAEWVQTEDNSDELNLTRNDIIQSLLIISSLHIFCPPFANDNIEISPSLNLLPCSELIKSISRVSFRYITDREENTQAQQLLTIFLKNCLCLCIRLFTHRQFREAFNQINVQNLLRGVYILETNKSLFDYPDSLTKESLSFLYMCALFNNNFVKEITSKGLSNKFISYLISHAQILFEKEKVNYVHSIILSTILLIVADEEAAKKLNEPFKEKLMSLYQVGDNFSYGDVLLSVLMNFCKRDSFLPSLICIFHMISPYAHIFSVEVAQRMMKIFEFVNGKNQNLLSLLLEVFATIVQQYDISHNGFCSILLFYSEQLRKIKPATSSMQKTIPIIKRYLKYAIALIKKESQDKLTLQQTHNIISKIHPGKLFPTPQPFEKHPHIYGGEIEKTWDQWADLIFQRDCNKEIQSIRNLRLHLAKQLQEKQAA